MRHGVPTTTEPKDPRALYMRNLFHTFFWGPFNTEDECAAAIAVLDKADDHWDYDPFCIIFGADPLPKDFVNGFHFLSEEAKYRIMMKARPKAS